MILHEDFPYSDKSARNVSGASRQVPESVDTISLNLGNDEAKRLGVIRTEHPSLIREARQLIATSYLKLGFIEPEHIDEEGVLAEEHDPYMTHSEYYLIRKSVEGSEEPIITSTIRKIIFNSEKGKESFPVMEHSDKFYPESQDQIEKVGLENCVEISALAKIKTDDPMESLKLYRSMWQEALTRRGTDKEEKLWIMASSPVLFDKFKIIFNGAVKRIGPNLDYPGQETIPALLDPVSGFIEIVESIKNNPDMADQRKMVVDFLIDGLSWDDLGGELNSLLADNGFIEKYEIEHHATYQEPVTLDTGYVDDMENVITADGENTVNDLNKKNFRGYFENRKPELISGLGLLAYTALRTEAVRRGISPDSDTDWRVFLGIEAVTTVPYVLGTGDVIRSIKTPGNFSKSRMIASGTVALGSFMAPYGYVGATGGESLTDPYVFGGIGVFFSLGTIGAIRKVRSARNSKLKLTD
jgi:hypothetical protein